MLVLPLMCFALAGASPEAEVTVLSASEPAPLDLLLLSPTGEPGRVSRSEALRAIEAALEAETELRAVTVDPSVNEDCRGRLPCIVEALRSDTTEADWLLVITQITLEGEADRVSSTLLHTSELPARLDEDAVDGVSRRVEPARVEDGAALRDLLARAFRGPLRPPLARADRLRAEGEIRLAPTTPGAIVHLDGRPLGTTGRGPTRIERVRRGRHELRLDAAGRSAWSRVVEVGDGPDSRLRPELSGTTKTGEGRKLGFAIGGATTAIAGGVLLALALAHADSAVKTACFSTRPGCEAGTGWTSFDYDPMAGAPRAVNPDGLGPGPLGAALLTTGVGLSVGALLEDGEVPWWSLGLSLAAGGAVLGASFALDGGRLP